MVPSMQQKPIENENSTLAEQAVANMRLMRNIEAKIGAQTPLDIEEINHLYQFDAPIYERTRDAWPYGFYGVDDPVLEARLIRYQDAQLEARQSSVEVLRVDYGDDADWLLATSTELEPRVSELLAAGASPDLLAFHVSPKTRLAHFDEFNAYGASLDPTVVYEASRDDDSYSHSTQQRLNAFVLKHETELIMDDESSHRLVRVLISEAGEEGLERAVEDALRVGAKHSDIVRMIPVEAIESRFTWLRDAGFEASILLPRCSNGFILDSFDELFHDSPEVLSTLSLNKPSLEDGARYMVALHRNGRPIRKHLERFNQGPHYSLTPQYEQMVAAGISIHDIVDTFSGNDESLIHLYAGWLMANGADPDAIKSKFSAGGIASVYKALQKEGIEVNLQEYADQLPTVELLGRRASFWEEAGVQIDYDAHFDTFDGTLTTDLTFAFLHAGVSPERVFTKVEAGALINDAMVKTFVDAGVPYETVWKKADKWMRQGKHWLDFTNDQSSDADFEAALQTLPLDRIKDSIEIVAKRPSFMNLFVDRLVEKHPLTHGVRELIEQGADVNHVLRNTLKGFYLVRNEASWLIERGADVHLLFEEINTQHPGMQLLDAFITGGVSKEQILDSLADNFVSNHITELTDRGFDEDALWSRAMKKPSADFVIKNIARLSALGYSADTLSSHLAPKQVVDTIADLLEAGMSPALAITQMMVVYRRPQAECEVLLAEKLGVAL